MQPFKITDQIFLVHDFWSKQKCQDFIHKSETTGYSEATIDAGIGQRVVKSIRNNKRLMYTDMQLANEIWQDLAQFVPETIGNSTAIGLNEMFRVYCYEPGEEFKRHRDQSYIRNTEARRLLTTRW